MKWVKKSGGENYAEGRGKSSEAMDLINTFQIAAGLFEAVWCHCVEEFLVWVIVFSFDVYILQLRPQSLFGLSCSVPMRNLGLCEL